MQIHVSKSACMTLSLASFLWERENFRRLSSNSCNLKKNAKKLRIEHNTPIESEVEDEVNNEVNNEEKKEEERTILMPEYVPPEDVTQLPKTPAPSVLRPLALGWHALLSFSFIIHFILHLALDWNVMLDPHFLCVFLPC